jgi:hypothetical protein
MGFIDLAAGFFRRNARSEGAAEGGCGGNSAAPERSAGAKRRRSVRIRLIKSSDFIQEGQPHKRKIVYVIFNIYNKKLFIPNILFPF